MSTNSNNFTKQNIEEYKNRLFHMSNNLEKTRTNSEVYEWLDYGLTSKNVTEANGNTNNIKKHKLLKKKFIQNCINWAAKYHAQSPYLYEITLDETTITRNNNDMNDVAASNNMNDNATNHGSKNIDNVDKLLNSNDMGRYNAGKILYKYAYIAGKKFEQDKNVMDTIINYMLDYYDSEFANISPYGKYDEFTNIINMALEGKIRDDKIITTSQDPDKFIKEFTDNFDKAMKNKSYTPDNNVNLAAINTSKKNTSARTRNKKEKKNKKKRTKKKTINYSNVQFKFHNSIKNYKFNINKFNITILLVLFYAFYIYDMFDKSIPNIHNDFDKSIITFLNNNSKYRGELNKLKNPNRYKLSDKYINKYYNNFIKTSIDAYHTADDFIDLNGTTYIISLHGGPITYFKNNDVPLLFKVPENVKIGFLTPLGSYGIGGYVNNYSYLSRSKGFTDIIKLGPSYYQSIANKVPLYLLNTNIYHTGQLVPNLRLSFSFEITFDDKEKMFDTFGRIKSNKFMYEYTFNSLHCNNLYQYIYHAITKEIISDYIYNKNQNTKLEDPLTKLKNDVHRKLTNKGDIDKHIYIRPDSIHNDSVLDMIISNIFIYENNKEINDLFNNFEENYKNPTYKDIFNRINNMIDKLIVILKTFNIEINNYSKDGLQFKFSTELSKHLSVINDNFKNDNGAKNGGNLYLFNACRFYSNSFDRFNITAQLSISYITNITNKYISSLINKISNHKNNSKYRDVLHTLNNVIPMKSLELYNNISNEQKKQGLLNYPSYMIFKYLALDISKDFTILIAINDLLKYIIILRDIDPTVNFIEFKNKLTILKYIFYELFIKSKYEYNAYLKYNNRKLSKLKMNKNNDIKINTNDNIYNVFLLLENYGILIRKKEYSNMLLNTIEDLLLKYYRIYIQWLYDNYSFNDIRFYLQSLKSYKYSSPYEEIKRLIDKKK
jgi:hypothetical protein